MNRAQLQESRKESFRKWGTFVVSCLALLFTCLRDPIAFTIKATVQQVLHQELGKYDSVQPANAKLDKHLDPAPDMLKRLDHDLQTLSSEPAAIEANRKLLVEINTCLISIESKLDVMIKDGQRQKAPP